ncbi:MAG: DUF4430 domain-containing protein [Candidatus Doudnabacteria bacterium]|nr:DUF4430 domain-containing protein [Candidatus Doudnabacteria bacterium]
MFKNSAKKLEIFVIISIIAIIGIIYALAKQPVVAPRVSQDRNQTESIQQVPQTAIQYQGVDGQNALSLLKAYHNVETKDYAGIGEYVISIDGIAPDSKHFWAFYVNEKQAEVGAGAYVTKSSDVIEWKLEEIK